MSLSLFFSHVLRSGVTHLGVDRFEICNKLADFSKKEEREKMARSEPLKHRIVKLSFAWSNAAPEIKNISRQGQIIITSEHDTTSVFHKSHARTK